MRASLTSPLVGGRHRVPPSPELERELASKPLWMYRWNLGLGVLAPTERPEDALVHVHETRLQMMEPAVREALAAAGPRARAIDLACNEGWFGHKLLEWGAAEVVGIDLREVNIRRARLVRDHYRIDPARLDFRQGDIYDLDPDELGRFDVVLLIGLVYHVEDPIGAVRIARRLCRGACVIEGQLTRQNEPVPWAMGPHVRHAPSSFAAYVEEDAETNPVASGVGIMSLIPNRSALCEMPRIAGFERVSFCEPGPDSEPQYINGDRGQVIAWAPEAGERG